MTKLRLTGCAPRVTSDNLRWPTDVRFGSKADIAAPPTNGRFTPKSGHWLSALGCPLCAKSRYSAVRRNTSLFDHLVGAQLPNLRNPACCPRLAHEVATTRSPQTNGPSEQIVDLSFVRKRPAAMPQWRGIADLQIDWQCGEREALGDRVHGLWRSSEMLSQVRAARLEPVVRIIVRREIVDAGEMEGFAPLNAGAAAPAMARAAPVAGPCFGKRHTEPRALAHDVGLAQAQERSRESNTCQAVECGALHRG